MAILGENWQPTNEGVYPKRILILGPAGSGKTTAAAVIAPGMVRDPEQLIVVGPKPDLAVKLNRPWNNVSPYDMKAMQNFFSKLYESPAHVFVVVDDFDLYSNARSYNVPALHELVRIGRGYGKGFMGIADGSSSIPKSLIANADLVIIYRTTEPNLLDYAEDYMDDFPGGPKEARYAISNLPPYEAIVWMPGETPKAKGILKVVNGQLYLVPWDEETKSPDASEPEGTAPEPASDATSSSPPGPGAPTAAGATQNTAAK